ncbi:MAG: fibronectin type III domain-containing protein [Acidimicrobiales bacterium]
MRMISAMLGLFTFVAMTPAAASAGSLERPAPPTGARCSDGGDDLSVSWSASSDAGLVDAYNIYRGVGSNPLATATPEVVATVEAVPGGADYAWTDVDRPFGTYNRYFVRAVAGGAESWRSNDVVCFASDPIPPTKPTYLRVSRVDTGLMFEWDPATDETGIESYRLSAGSRGYDRVVAEVSGDQTSAVVPLELFVAGGEYRFWVRAHDGYNSSGASNAVILIPTADTTRPGRASGLTVNVTEFANELEWLPAEDNGAVSHYLVYRSVDGAEFEVVHETPVAWTEWQDLSVEPNRTYAYYLRAVDLAGNIGWRNGIVAVSTGPAEDSAPPTFTRFGSAGATAAAITMGWEVSDNVGVTGLSLSVYDTDGVLVAVAHPPVDTASYTVNGLRSATRYFFVLEARDAAGNVGTNRTSAWTESIRPEPVRNMAAVATAEGVALSWDASVSDVGIREYWVFRAVNGGDHVEIVRVTETSYLDVAVEKGVTYSYYVRPVDTFGFPGWRNGFVVVRAA